MKRSSLFLPFFIIYASVCFSQQKKLDSLENIWKSEIENDSIKYEAQNEYYKLINEINPDSTLILLKQNQTSAINRKDNFQLFLVTKWIGNINRFKGNLDIALNSYYKADSIAIILNNKRLRATIKGNIGNVFANKRDYSNAIQYFSESLTLYQQVNDNEGIARILTSLGTLHLYIENYAVSQKYYEKVLDQLQNIENSDRNYAVITNNIGWSLYKRGKYTQALSKYEEALVLYKQQNRKFLIAGCYETLSLIHKELGNLEKAKDFAYKNYQLNKQLKREASLFNAEINIALILFESNVEEALSEAENLLNRMPLNTDITIKSKLYKLLYKCYKEKNKPEKALKMYEFYTVYNDSLQIEKNNYAVARETVKKDFELQLYENKLENEKAQARLEITQLKRTYTILGISILIIGILIIFFRKQHIKSQNKRASLLEQINQLKNESKPTILPTANSFELNREKIETSINRNLNETDWKVLTILLDDPVITNKKIAEKAHKSIDGIGSSLRRMYDYFEIQETKYKKIALLTNAIKRSKSE